MKTCVQLAKLAKCGEAMLKPPRKWTRFCLSSSVRNQRIRTQANRAYPGFTLIELLVVMAIIATLLSIAAPRYFDHLQRSREATLKQTLMIVRDAIDKYRGDNGRYPNSLDELVEKHYLRSLPVDPINDSNELWTLVTPPAPEMAGKLYDLHSSAEGEAKDGTPYASW